ncbi:coiled-coil domain-containing protein [Actinocorallia populi]|uniref:coiled-coil domain-containing protein n=1 Tax=Actinocorallia populi TaxID=2079200 RepID=UPI000D094B12|nr:hypothetical protein [Actinocorallia populi]
MTSVRRRAGAALAAAIGALILAAPSSGAVVPLPSDGDKLRQLSKQLNALDKELGGELEELKDIRRSAQLALQRKKDLAKDLDRSRNVVSRLASSQYMANGIDPTLSVLQPGDPSTLLSGMSLVSHLATNESHRTNQIQHTLDLQAEAAKEAKDKLKKLEKKIKQLETRKDDIKKQIERFAPTPIVGEGGMTPRMRTLRDAILEKYRPFPMIGCTRSGDPMDHGSGRACDFMESAAGAMPTPDRLRHGDQVAAFAINNAQKYGVKYVIWKQRIYDIRSPGWSAMSDRGSITQNHWDHVHISVF